MINLLSNKNSKNKGLQDLKISKEIFAVNFFLLEISRNQKYLVPDLKDVKTMQESIKRVRQLLMERCSKTKRQNSNSNDQGH
jgi:thiazole synthase ThiGH ThiG subunit